MFERGAINEDRLKFALAPVPIISTVGRKFWDRRKSAFTQNYQAYREQYAASGIGDTLRP
ncbi:MAG: hypothetical protein AAGA61_04885 [Pseudomonadota bacterium]